MTDDLFGWEETGGRARRDDPETSHEAAALVDVTRLENMVIATLKRVGDLTTHEIEDATGLAAGSVTPRMRPLEEKGLVVRTGKRIPRGHKRNQTIWHVRK